jgi:hypothetical protein
MLVFDSMWLKSVPLSQCPLLYKAISIGTCQIWAPHIHSIQPRNGWQKGRGGCGLSTLGGRSVGVPALFGSGDCGGNGPLPMRNDLSLTSSI